MELSEVIGRNSFQTLQDILVILTHGGIARGQLAIETILDPMILGKDLAIVFGGQSTERDQLDALHLYRSAARVVGVEAAVA